VGKCIESLFSFSTESFTLYPVGHLPIN